MSQKEFIMPNIKLQARKYHETLGIIFALPLLWATITATLAVIIEEFFHNESLADYVLKFHTLEIIGLEDIYPFIFLTGVIGLVTTAIIMLKKNSNLPKS
jgi:glycerol-3-phosphate acyltransferase PlsY